MYKILSLMLSLLVMSSCYVGRGTCNTDFGVCISAYYLSESGEYYIESAFNQCTSYPVILGLEQGDSLHKKFYSGNNDTLLIFLNKGYSNALYEEITGEPSGWGCCDCDSNTIKIIASESTYPHEIKQMRFKINSSRVFKFVKVFFGIEDDELFLLNEVRVI